MAEVLRALVVMTCWWHQDIAQSLFSAEGLKFRQPIQWPCDLFPGPPLIYKHNESWVFAGNARLVQRAAKHFLFVSSALFSAYFITICDNESFPKRKKSTTRQTGLISECCKDSHLLSKCSESLSKAPLPQRSVPEDNLEDSISSVHSSG